MQTFRADAVAPQRAFDDILARAQRGSRLEHDEVVELFHHGRRGFDAILDVSGRLRDAGHGRRITYSTKVFVPVTRLCRDECGYCAFRRSPGEVDSHTLEADEVLALARAGACLGVKEALISLGDRPEARFSEHRAWLAERGYATTLEYVAALCRRILDETALAPHVNAGVMSENELERLRPVCASMGLMLECISDRLLQPGGAHEHAPDKTPARRLATLEMAGRLKIPFTTGILIGVGETLDERAASLLAIRDLHDRYGHVQEVIVQNFRAKPGTPMQDDPEPSFEDLQLTLAIARLVFGPPMNLQAPPNLSAKRYLQLIRAGLNDWGGVSPVTIDHINPEAPWPQLKALRDGTMSMGYELRERLPVYPEYILKRRDFVDPALRARLADQVDGDGLVHATREAVRWG